MAETQEDPQTDTQVDPRADHDEARRAAFLEHLAITSSVKKSMTVAGIAKSTLYSWKNNDPDFEVAWMKALAEGYALLEMEMLERARAGVERKIFYHGEHRETVRDYDHKTALVLLRMHKESVALVRAAQAELAAESAAAKSNRSAFESGVTEPGTVQQRIPSESQLDQLESIHRRKTGALFAASLDLGAILAGAKSEQREILGNYARDLGLAFQVVDDLLDFTADSDSVGKRTGKDADRGKLTYPGLLGVDQARDKAEQLVESARHHISVFGKTAWRLRWLASYVLERTH